ncbi:MAG: hypothetical protein ACRDTF_00720 [Pseudonocardiaceae bacterium]
MRTKWLEAACHTAEMYLDGTTPVGFTVADTPLGPPNRETRDRVLSRRESS